ncbi:hypothetical protein AVEN_263390-1 [Araneus ventricosus]|uniref:Uncharacterized protein n=1 Tax=Araneus ventricosus TaxID=182803 RepID=A0A4Y2LIS7_ARAVE|nr:hypothetical protein AVEN_263390-1 [Araneus ventricosus]
MLTYIKDIPEVSQFFSVSHSPGSKPDSPEDPPRPLHATQWPNVFPLVRCGSLERVPAMVLPLSSDHGSK